MRGKKIGLKKLKNSLIVLGNKKLDQMERESSVV